MISDTKLKLNEIINMKDSALQAKLTINKIKFSNIFLRTVVKNARLQGMETEDILTLVLDLDKMADDDKVDDNYNDALK
jgi:hypothetical protein